MADEWGPLGALVGDWEAEGGLDTAYSHSQEKVLGTPYLERVSFKPFGPVDNGRQHLYGLDYKTAMWRGSEENPFHTEVGYWLWDGATGEVLRGFVVPRGITVLAGGTAAADAKEFTLTAEPGDRNYNIGENKYLTANASTLELPGHDHDQRRRLVVLRRDHHAEDGRDGRALRPHRPQHPPPQSRLAGTTLRDAVPEELDRLADGEPETLVDADRVVVAVADVEDRRLAAIDDGGPRPGGSVRPRVRGRGASGCVHTALISVWPGRCMRSPAIATSCSPSNTPT